MPMKKAFVAHIPEGEGIKKLLFGLSIKNTTAPKNTRRQKESAPHGDNHTRQLLVRKKNVTIGKNAHSKNYSPKYQ